MAGGQGTRFWPASRRARPKQFLRIAGKQTMLQETVARLRGLCRPEHIVIVTGAEHLRLARAQARGVPAANFIGEPVGRSTAPCIGVAAQWIAARAPEALMVVLPADHAIRDARGFRATLRRALRIAAGGEHLVTIGIPPSRPEVGYGYIELGEPLPGEGSGAHAAAAFHEKPSRATAEDYCESGRFLWNSGVFVWRAGTFRAALERHLPQTAAALRPLAAARTRRAFDLALRRAYRRVEAISVDHGVMEKADRVAVVTAEFDWNDVGSWAAMAELWQVDDSGNAVRGEAVVLDALGNVVLAERRIVAVLGVDGLIVVDTPDALLVCDKSRAQDVRKIVQELDRRGRRRVL
jgi:mannose-1-phosphate guanylyltransferase